MFGLKSYAFDLFFTKRPAAVYTKSGKVFSISGICNVAIAECGMRIAELDKASSDSRRYS